MMPAGRQGLSAVRANLEHKPRDPFAVDVQQVLDALHAEWGHVHVLAYRPDSGRPWQARRCEHPTAILAGATPDELVRELERDWGEA